MGTPLWTILVYIIVSVFGALATFNLKVASAKISPKIRQIIKNKRLILAVFLYGVGTLISLVALKYGELSVLYPFAALQYVWANLLSKVYLKEKLTPQKWLGIVLISIGVSLIGIGA